MWINYSNNSVIHSKPVQKFTRALMRCTWAPYSKDCKEPGRLGIQNLHILWKFETQGQFFSVALTGMQSSRENHHHMHGGHCYILNDLLNLLCCAVTFFLSPPENWLLFLWLHSSYFSIISRNGSGNVSRIILRFPLISAKAVSKGICSLMAAGFWDSGLTPQGSLDCPVLTLGLRGESWLFEGQVLALKDTFVEDLGDSDWIPVQIYPNRHLWTIMQFWYKKVLSSPWISGKHIV